MEAPKLDVSVSDWGVVMAGMLHLHFTRSHGTLGRIFDDNHAHKIAARMVSGLQASPSSYERLYKLHVLDGLCCYPHVLVIR